MNFRWLLFILLLQVACQPVVEEKVYSNDKGEVTAYNLINPLEAKRLMEANPLDYILVQVSKNEVFKKEHLVGALNVWRPDYCSKEENVCGGLMASSAEVEDLLQRLGFREGKTLLLYDAKANVDAFRLAWIFSYYGFQDFKVINGGLKYCKASGLAVRSDVTRLVRRSDYTFHPKINASIAADFSEVMASIKDPNTLLIDTREDYEFLGQPFIKDKELFSYKKGAFNRGSIPGAINLNWSTLADLSGDHRIKSINSLRFDLKEKGISPDKNIILYCQSGSRTSHTFYVLKHVLGYPSVKNYDGSWIEWSYKNSIDSTVPINQQTADKSYEEMYQQLEKQLAK